MATYDGSNIDNSSNMLNNPNKERARRSNTYNSTSYSHSNVEQAIKYEYCINQLDVIASSKHVKTLLKMPFTHEPISLAVHRIGKTLIFDDFYLNLSSHKMANENWKKQDVEDATKHHGLYNKFTPPLSFERRSSLPELTSTVESDSLNSDNCASVQNEAAGDSQPPLDIIPFNDSPQLASNDFQIVTYPNNSPATNPVLPAQHNSSKELIANNMARKTNLRHRRNSDSDISTSMNIPTSIILNSLPQPRTLTYSSRGEIHISYGPYLRDALWKFEDISMLLGSDMPIFGMGQYPAVSLFLQDSNKPISILTGIDLWLDNMINNVPEVLMAYHVNNIINNYEYINTNTIPYLSQSKFCPQLIKEICGNIMHFIKANCTKEGHTYWLLREKGEDIIKLYDLTSLLGPRSDTQLHNPFVHPVAHLFYKVAKRIHQNLSTHQNTSEYFDDLSIVNHMLNQAIKLLSKLQPCELLIQSYNILTEIYVNDRFIETILDCVTENSYSLSNQNSKSKRKNKKSKTLTSNSTELIQASTMQMSWPIAKLTNSFDENEFAQIFKPTPFAYGTNEEMAKMALNYLNCAISASIAYESVEDCLENKSIINKITSHLWFKASASFYMFSKTSFSENRYGASAKYVQNALRCLANVNSGKDDNLICKFRLTIVQFLGDIFCFIADQCHKYETFISEFETTFVHEFGNLLDLTPTVPKINDFVPSMNFFSTRPDNLLNSADCYRYVEKGYRQLCRPSKEMEKFWKRLGNVYNELGLLTMQVITNQPQLSSTEQIEYAKTAYQYFQKGIEYFCEAKDKVNESLLHSNNARLMRLCALLTTNDVIKNAEKIGFNATAKNYFGEAIVSYGNGIKLLTGMQNQIELYDTLKLELSAVKLQMGTIWFDTEVDSHDLNEVTNLLQNSASGIDEVLKNGVLTQTPTKRQEILIKLGTCYNYLGLIEIEALKKSIKLKENDRCRSYFHLVQKYFSMGDTFFNDVTSIKNELNYCHFNTAIISRLQIATRLQNAFTIYAAGPNVKNISTKNKIFAQSFCSLTQVNQLLKERLVELRESTPAFLNDLCKYCKIYMEKLADLAEILTFYNNNENLSNCMKKLNQLLKNFNYLHINEKSELEFDKTVFLSILNKSTEARNILLQIIS